MKRTNKSFNILCCDPSMTAWGWVVLNDNKNILDYGCIKTAPEQKKRRIRKGDDTVRRISEINQHLLKIIRKHHISYIISELPHGSQNASAAKMIGIVAGVIQTLSDTLEIGIEWYSEGDAKKNLLGRQSATKQEIINEINKLYNIIWTGVKYKDEAIADSLAIHYVALKQSSTLMYLQKNR